MFFDGKEAVFVLFDDFTKLDFPLEDSNQITIESDASTNSSDIRGSRNTVIQGKNIVTGTVITAGSFRLGDG